MGNTSEGLEVRTSGYIGGYYPIIVGEAAVILEMLDKFENHDLLVDAFEMFLRRKRNETTDA